MRVIILCVLGLVFFAPIASAQLRKMERGYEVLERIFLPVVEFKDAGFNDVILFLRHRSAEAADILIPPEDRAVKIYVVGPDFIYDGKGDPPELLKKMRVNYKAKDKRFTDVIEAISKKLQLNLYITSDGVVFCLPGTPPKVHQDKEPEILDTLLKFPVPN